VADAGFNTLDFVDRSGKISILQYFGWRDPNPNNFPSDAVPTCVARTDDALWVGQLSGQLFRVEGTQWPGRRRRRCGSSRRADR